MNKHPIWANIKNFKLKSMYFNYLRSYLLIILLCFGGLFTLFSYYMVSDFNVRLEQSALSTAEKDTTILNAQLDSLRKLHYSLYTNTDINNFTALNRRLFHDSLETTLTVANALNVIKDQKSQFSGIKDIIVYNPHCDYMLTSINGKYSSEFENTIWYPLLSEDTRQVHLLCDDSNLYIFQNLNKGALILVADNPFASTIQDKDIYVFFKNTDELIYGSDNLLSFPISSDNRLSTTHRENYFYIQYSSDSWVTYVYQFPVYSFFDNNSFIIVIITMAAVLALLLILLSFYQTHLSYRHITNILSVIGTQEADSSVFSQNELHFIYNQLINSMNNKELIEAKLTENVEQLKRAQNIALQTQIEPHYLLNVLSMINSSIQCTIRGDCQGTRMITLLSHHLRVSLSTRNNLIPLREELENTFYYIELEKLIHDEMLQFVYDVDESCLDITCPRLILQPIIENSILHGMYDNEIMTITLQISHCKTYIQIRISDDGRGLTAARVSALRAQLSDIPENKHIGLTNVIKRLQLIYGDHFRYDIQSGVGSGTSIILQLVPLSGK